MSLTYTLSCIPFLDPSFWTQVSVRAAVTTCAVEKGVLIACGTHCTPLRAENEVRERGAILRKYMCITTTLALCQFTPGIILPEENETLGWCCCCMASSFRGAGKERERRPYQKSDSESGAYRDISTYTQKMTNCCHRRHRRRRNAYVRRNKYSTTPHLYTKCV